MEGGVGLSPSPSFLIHTQPICASITMQSVDGINIRAHRRHTHSATYIEHTSFSTTRYETDASSSSAPHIRNYAPAARKYTYQYSLPPGPLREPSEPARRRYWNRPHECWVYATECGHLTYIERMLEDDNFNQLPKVRPPWCHRCLDVKLKVAKLREATTGMRQVGGPGPLGGIMWWEEPDDDGDNLTRGPVTYPPMSHLQSQQEVRKLWDGVRVAIANLRAQAHQDDVNIERALEGVDEMIAIFSGRIDFTSKATAHPVPTTFNQHRTIQTPLNPNLIFKSTTTSRGILSFLRRVHRWPPW